MACRFWMVPVSFVALCVGSLIASSGDILGNDGAGGTAGPLPPGAPGMDFRRGDSNIDGVVDLSDPVSTLSYLLLAAAPPNCEDAADSNDDEVIDISDPINTLDFLFLGNPSSLSSPGPYLCGPDLKGNLDSAGHPAAEQLDCQDYPACDQFDADGDGLTDGTERAMGIDPNNSDTDKDSFKDGEEVLPNGVEGELSIGNTDPSYPVYAADPRKPDIYVEADWFDYQGAEQPAHDHKPSLEAIRAVVKAFQDAPIETKVGDVTISTGIALHVDLGQLGGGNAIIFHDEKHDGTDALKERYLTSVVASICIWCRDYRSYKVSHFDPKRDKVFHYSLWCHWMFPGAEADGGWSQLIYHENFVVTATHSRAFFDANRNKQLDDEGDRVLIEGGLFMHELGHNLGLRHGGNEELNCKPNYNSVMSYRNVRRGIDVNRDGRPDYAALDYSRGNLIDLAEGHLDEFSGIDGVTAIDWNGNCNLETSVAVDINNDLVPDPIPPCFGGIDDGYSRCDLDGIDPDFTLHDFNDWGAIQQNGMGAPRAVAPGQLRAGSTRFCSPLPNEACSTSTGGGGEEDFYTTCK